MAVLTNAYFYHAAELARNLAVPGALALLGRKLDFGDLDFSEALAVSDELADALLGLVLEDENLLVFRLANDFAENAGAFDQGASDRDVGSALAGQHDLVEGDGGAGLTIDGIAADRVSLAHAKLFSIGFDDRVHNLGRVPSRLFLCQRPVLAPVGAKRRAPLRSFPYRVRLYAFLAAVPDGLLFNPWLTAPSPKEKGKRRKP